MSEDEPVESTGWDRRWGVAIGIVAAVCVRLLPTPDGMGADAHSVAAVAVMMAGWWVFGVLPMPVTALVPLVAFPLIGIASLKEVATSYAHPLLYLMLGGFVIGHAMERVGLHRRLTAWMLAPSAVRRSPQAVLAALMLVGGGLSGLVSNTATTLMMLPLAVHLADRCGGGPARPAFVLGLAYSTSIGGMTTLVGTPPNAVFAGLAPTLIDFDVGFDQWMLMGVPTAAVMLPLAWWCVTRVGFEVPDRFVSPLEAPDASEPAEGERAVWALTALAMLAWLTRSDKAFAGLTVPGWGSLLPGSGSEADATVAMGVALLLFLVPTPKGRRRFLLDWREVEAAVPWSVLLLLGGGFALAGAISKSGLTAWIASGAVHAQGLPLPLTVLVLCLGMTFVTELTSNTATATIALPLLSEAALVAGVPPLAWIVPATLSASCAFMMPVATAPNAIAAEAGGVAARDMARTGFALNVLGAVAITILATVWMPLVF
jgi:sodium-dependent dicarboxylate transporter 2/3/5